MPLESSNPYTGAMTWAFSIWAAFRAWQESFPPWKERLVYLLLSAYAMLALDVIF